MDFDVRTSDEKMRDLNSSTFEGRIAQEPQTRFTDAFNVLPFQDNTGPEFDK